MSRPTYVVGIDLGTTNCVMAESLVQRPSVNLVHVPQLVAPGELSPRPMLPSFAYLPAPGELAPEDYRLPWGESNLVVGHWARSLGAQVPARLVASAKSWICHGGVRRKTPILPWCAPDGEWQVSPFDASVEYLQYLKKAWERAHPEHRLAEQDVVVTVPASFDESARALTAEAASQAGLGDVRLLEEPQAAFYNILESWRHDDTLPRRGAVLVVDVGGGTTDLTLLRVSSTDAPGAASQFERIAVGGHLMLGGDNMDAALAHHALEQSGIERKLDPTEWSALVQSTRAAKERILGHEGAEVAYISLHSRGSKLLGAVKNIALRGEDVTRILLDGFLPFTQRDQVAKRAGRPGLTSLGLPYVTDPAIPKHVCAFLRHHARSAQEAGTAVADGLPIPDAVLLNGGIFKSHPIAERMMAVVEGWYGRPLRSLPNPSLDTSVACGAVLYGLSRHGIGQRISGGSARAYYIGFEDRDGAQRALCVAPRGMTEGTNIYLTARRFALTINRRVQFPVFCYTGERHDEAGALVDVDDEMVPIPALQTVLRSDSNKYDDTVDVSLASHMSERGGLSLFLNTYHLPPERFRLEFSLKANEGASLENAASDTPASNQTEASKVVGAALKSLHDAFAFDDPARPATARRAIEDMLGPRGQWTAEACRALWTGLMEHQRDRARSAGHELHWLRLVGWCLRPGVGMPEDEERMAALWHIYDAGLLHSQKSHWAEWWTLWRRVAAGLSARQQQHIFRTVACAWEPGALPAGAQRPKGTAEMQQLVAVLERLSGHDKRRAGEWVKQQTREKGSWLPLGRLGAREPVFGSAADVVETDVASAWLEHLFALEWQSAEGSAWAGVLLALRTGDPKRDVPADLRREVIRRLEKINASPSWVSMVKGDPGRFTGFDRQVLGEALPVGLRMTDLKEKSQIA